MNYEETTTKSNSFMKIIKGSIISIVISIILLFIFAIILTYTNVSESVMVPVIICITAVSILIGGVICSSNIRKNGLFNGGLVGVIYILVLYLISSFITGKFNFSTYSIIMILVSIASGALGGIFGVNKR